MKVRKNEKLIKKEIEAGDIIETKEGHYLIINMPNKSLGVIDIESSTLLSTLGSNPIEPKVDGEHIYLGGAHHKEIINIYVNNVMELN